jgi:shikimate dehydrogenase
MYTAAVRATGIRARYVAVRTGPAEVAAVLRALATAGGGGNVTRPLKHGAFLAVHRASGAATLLEACNTFWREGEEVVGTNTDVAGIAAAVDELAAPPGGWLVIGTGASARAAVAAAAARGAPVAVESRDEVRGREFLEWAASAGATVASPDDCVVLVNTAPLGLRDDGAVPRKWPPATVAALDLSYGRAATPWVRAAHRRGLRAADGRDGLVAQGAAAFTCWFPDVVPPTAEMRRAVDAALE